MIWEVKEMNNVVKTLIFMTVASAVAGISWAGLTDGLVAYYPFNGNAEDISGNGHHGTVHGATLTTDRFGNTNGAYRFDGINDFIRIPHHSSFNVSTELTLTAWVNSDNMAKFDQDFFCKNNDARAYALNLNEDYESPQNYKFCFLVSTTHRRQFLYSDEHFDSNRWYHVTGVYDGNNVRIYVDGMLEGETPLQGTVKSNSDPLTIGSHTGGSGEYFDGMVDDVRIYNRALSESEILALYHDEDPKKVSIIVGAGPGRQNRARVLVYDSEGNKQTGFLAYFGEDMYGVNVAGGDVLGGDGLDTIVTGMGPGPENPALVRVFEPHGIMADEFLAYGCQYGVKVACGDIDGDGLDEILTSPGPGTALAPHVRAFQYNGSRFYPVSGFNLMAYLTRKFGCNISVGELDGDGYDEIIASPGPGPGFSPQVRGFNYDSERVSLIPDIGFLAYRTRHYGCLNSNGDVDDDGFDEIITTPGQGRRYGSHIRVWNYDGSSVTKITNFFAYRLFFYGAMSAVGNMDADGYEEILTAPGPGSLNPAYIRGWNVEMGFAQPNDDTQFYAFGNSYKYGATLGTGYFGF